MPRVVTYCHAGPYASNRVAGPLLTCRSLEDARYIPLLMRGLRCRHPSGGTGARA
jgi:hypothetical protein